jgi:hypothetical protein
MALCLLILDECGVACTPGLDFDPLRGGKYIRFSFSGETTVFVLLFRRTAFFFFSRNIRFSFSGETTVFVFTLQAHCLFFLEEVFFVLINLV